MIAVSVSGECATGSSTVFLPLVTAADGQVDDADDDLPAEALLTEDELLQQYEPQVQAAAVIATNGKIAFSSNLDGDADIYTINADGTGLVSLTNNALGLHQTEPTWSPDGTKIAFVMGSALNAAGVGPQSLITRGIGVEYGEPEWSPDGRLITDLHYANQPELWVMHADGTNQTQVVPANVVNLQAPAFAPDGKLLTVIGQPAGVAGAGKELFVLPAPVAPLPALAVTSVTATRLTTTGGIASADWQKKLVTAMSLTVRTVSQRGGTGIVTSQPSGINCGTQCTMTVAAGTKVTLTAPPQAGAKFVKWTGACTGKALTCTVTINKARLALAYFKQK